MVRLRLLLLPRLGTGLDVGGLLREDTNQDSFEQTVKEEGFSSGK